MGKLKSGPNCVLTFAGASTVSFGLTPVRRLSLWYVNRPGKFVTYAVAEALAAGVLVVVAVMVYLPTAAGGV
jgi:hypothetical protein